MRRAFACAVVLVVTAVTPTGADTLGEVLRAHGVRPPAGLPDLDQQVGARTVTQDVSGTIVVYDAGGERGPARLVALRIESGTGAFTRVPLAWPRSAPRGLDPDSCRRLDSARSHANTILVTAHVTPSAACTLVLGRGLALRAVLAGWPVASLAGGGVVYQRNQVHFAAVHPLALGLFDAARLADTPLYPRMPYQAARAAHAARMRQVYTEAWCAARNHPCAPDVFDERLASDVLVADRGDALAFVVAFDNTTGWSDAERWGRLEPFRELRATLSRWDGRGEPSGAFGRSLVAGLDRARNLGAGPHVAAALSDEPDLRDLVGGVLAARRVEGVDPARWLLTLDGRWGEAATWLRLGRLIAVPDEVTEVVYVYAGLRPRARIRYRELPRREFEARFGPGALRAPLEPAVLRELFGTRPE